MKKKLYVGWFLISLLTLNTVFVNVAFAEDEAPVEPPVVEEPSIAETPVPVVEDKPTAIEKEITLENECEVVDTDGKTHTFPKEDSPSDYLGICALAIAKNTGAISGFALKDSDYGLYLTSINNIDAGADEYWSLYLNDAYATCGVGCLPLEIDDEMSLVLMSFADEVRNPGVVLRIIGLSEVPKETTTENPSENSGSTGGGSTSGTTQTPNFDIQKAMTYLKSVQNPNGSFVDSLLYTDWAAIALGALNITDSSYELLIEYFNLHKEPGSLLTDNERRAMALLASNKNPYSFAGVNYIDIIIKAFDGTQFGDTNLVNDDIFALIPLANAGYSGSDSIITKDIAFILSKQSKEGSWEGSVDITAAAIQALAPFDSVPGVSDALANAGKYIENEQSSNGGWGNVSSTSWAMQAESALSATWKKDGKGGIDYLASLQATDGATALSTDTLANRIWATSYAIAAASGKTWKKIMQSVSKPESENVAASPTLNSASEKKEEQIEENKILAETVWCRPGDLFNGGTGEPCNKNTQNDRGVLETIAVNKTEEGNNQNKKVTEIKTEPKTENAEITTGENKENLALTATAINALGESKNPLKSLKFLLAPTLGLIALYSLFKFWKFKFA